MMRFLANENFPLASIKRLREWGYDIAAIVEDSPGISDHEVLSRADREQRLILTFDRDYGELIYRLRLPVPPGVLYLRFVPDSPTEPAEYVQKLINTAGMTLEKKFTVGEKFQVRQRTLP